jgi:SAM-dependent methyltransferase
VHSELLQETTGDFLDVLAGPDPFFEIGPGKVLSGVAPKNGGPPSKEWSNFHELPITTNPKLPFADESFEAALLSIHVGILKFPIELFREISRVLKPEGIFIVTIIHPYYSKNLTRMWALGDDHDHVVLVDAFFEYSNGFTKHEVRTLIKAGDRTLIKPLGIPPDFGAHDYIFAFWAFKGAVPQHSKDNPAFPIPDSPAPKTKEDLKFDPEGVPACPHCQSQMEKVAPPVTVFEIDYGVALVFVCFDQQCPYYRKSKSWMRIQGRPGFTYRFSYNPDNGAIGPIPDDLLGNLATSKIE